MEAVPSVCFIWPVWPRESSAPETTAAGTGDGDEGMMNCGGFSEQLFST